MTTENHLLSRIALGLVRVAAISPELRVADVGFNTSAIVDAMERAAQRGCQLALFPELCVTGYTCADLFYQSALLNEAWRALGHITNAAMRHHITAVVGLPLLQNGRLFNCAACIGGGKVLGVVPKTYLPNTNEYYEQRWFSSSRHGTADTLEVNGKTIPFGTNLLFCADKMPSFVIGIEICEDLWSVSPPSGNLALAGATILLNPSASDELLGKADYRHDLVKQQSARCLAAYVYAGANPNESTTDVVFGGHAMIAEYGVMLAETERFRFTTEMAIADIDIHRLNHERLTSSSFSMAGSRSDCQVIPFEVHEPPADRLQPPLLRPVARMPFVPSDLAQRARHCREIFSIQSTGLAKRLKHTGVTTATIGISGGLDSTLALLVAIRAFDIMKLDRRGIMAITMPGFGTTARTRSNAERLAELVGVTLRQIPIHDAVRQHFKDIGHQETIHDVTYENAQARERTQILMDVANEVGGFTIGTGDLSELALGWATFNGDHMSMYHVNAGVPKTLVRYLVEWTADSEFSGDVSAVLRDICVTPITPELLPLGEGDQLLQDTEATIGPYLLHDFFLFQVVRHGFPPGKVYFLARQAFGEQYTPAVLLHWLSMFYRRFFSQQFKRSAMPDGPKVGTVALSPRGDWRMPSDASSALWLQEIELLKDALANTSAGGAEPQSVSKDGKG